MDYVIGFAMHEDSPQHMLMVEKNRPQWQAGKWNGIGGKVEPSDLSIYDAVSREFEEEAGIKTDWSDWTFIAVMHWEDDIMGGQANVYVLKTHLAQNKYMSFRTVTDEKILSVNTDDDFWKLKCVSNLKFLVPLVRFGEEFSAVVLNAK